MTPIIEPSCPDRVAAIAAQNPAQSAAHISTESVSTENATKSATEGTKDGGTPASTPFCATQRRAPSIECPTDVPAIRVLASGSGGNCTVLTIPQPEHGSRRVVLIDAGLSPRRTTRLLDECGIGDWEIDDIILTHLDMDHFHRGWAKQRRRTTTLRLHVRHRGRAERLGALHGSRIEPFSDCSPSNSVDLPGGLSLSSVLLSHDQHGVAVLRIALPGGASLGFATDVGSVTPAMIEHLSGADVLAVESNYCPDMQAASDRPAFLKKRITGGSGHLSNQECMDAIEQIDPRGHVVFLHLSRECNRPELVSSMHAGGRYAFTIADQTRATRWIPIVPAATRPVSPRPRTPAFSESLFASATAARSQPSLDPHP